MGGCRCSYKGCTNTTKMSDNLHFFHYPVKHKERCKIWIENANKPQFCNLEEDQLRNKVICEVHFESKYFPNPQRKRLLQLAVPTIDGDSEIVYKHQTIKPPIDVNNIEVLPANDDGTIFLLETDHFYLRSPRSQKIESYVYKNGCILPADAAMKELQLNNDIPSPPLQQPPIKMETLNHFMAPKLNIQSDKIVSQFAHQQIAEQQISHQQIAEEQIAEQQMQTLQHKISHQQMIPQKQMVQQNKKFLQQQNCQKIAQALKQQAKIKSVFNQQHSSDQQFTHQLNNLPTEMEQDEYLEEPIEQNSDFVFKEPQPPFRYQTTENKSPPKFVIKPTEKSVGIKPTEKSVGINYLKKIKQHSRDIASIKKILMDKSTSTNLVSMSHLKTKLPPSLFTIVQINLENKHEFTKEDKDFFLALYKTSPEAYSMLAEKFNWKLPKVMGSSAPSSTVTSDPIKLETIENGD